MSRIVCLLVLMLGAGCHDFAQLSSGLPRADAAVQDAAAADAAPVVDACASCGDLSSSSTPDLESPSASDLLMSLMPDLSSCGGAGTMCSSDNECCTGQGLACDKFNTRKCVTCLGAGQACGTAACCAGLGCIQDPVTLNYACGTCRSLGQPCTNARACCEGLSCYAVGGCKP
jgi:hypothetical protein